VREEAEAEHNLFPSGVDRDIARKILKAVDRDNRRANRHAICSSTADEGKLQGNRHRRGCSPVGARMAAT